MLKTISADRFPVAVAFLAFAFLTNPLFASDALQRIPENALGFVVVRNLEQTSAKVDRLLKQLHITFPAPLAFAKIVTGVESGLDQTGDLVVTLMPGARSGAPIEPMVLLPVSDYAEFAASIHGDTSGDVCRVTLVGEDLLIAQDGRFAMVMNVEHRQTLEHLVGLKAQPIPQLRPITTWLNTNDVSLVLMPSGMEVLGEWKEKRLRRRKEDFDLAQVPRVQRSNNFTDLFGHRIGHWLSETVELAAFGIVVDDQQNIRLSQKFFPKTNLRDSALAAEVGTQPSALLGKLSESFVFAGGGPVAPGWGSWFATFLLEHEQENLVESGLENITPELWKREAEAYRSLFADIRSCSVVMLPGQKGDPLLGNFLGIATVPKVSTYFDRLPQVVETWNEFSKQTTIDVRPEFELKRRVLGGKVLGGKACCEIIIDVATTAQDPNVPIINWLLEAMLGRDGKIEILMVEIDETNFAFGFATDEQITQLLSDQEQTESPAPQSPGIEAPDREATLKLLQADAAWRIIVSPQGCTFWTTRVVNEFMVHLGWEAIELPAMPASPPVGLSVGLVDGRWESELICPAETFSIVANYLEAIRGKWGGLK